MIELGKPLVLSLLFYGCESWTVTADLERRIPAFENKCYRTILGMSYREHKTNEYVWQQVIILAGRLRSVYCQPSGFAGFYGSAISIIMMRCRRSYYKGQWFVVIAEEDLINHGKTTSRHGQASRSLQRITNDTGRWVVIAADTYVGEPQRRLDD